MAGYERFHWTWKDSTGHATSPKPIKSRNKDFSVSRSTHSNWDFSLNWNLNLYRGIWVSRFGGFHGCSIVSGICRSMFYKDSTGTHSQKSAWQLLYMLSRVARWLLKMSATHSRIACFIKSRLVEILKSQLASELTVLRDYRPDGRWGGGTTSLKTINRVASWLLRITWKETPHSNSQSSSEIDFWEFLPFDSLWNMWIYFEWHTFSKVSSLLTWNGQLTRRLRRREKKSRCMSSTLLAFGLRREVGGWGRDPKKCTGRDWGMGSSTI